MKLTRQLLLALLAGLLVTVGGLVAPLLFVGLDDRALAGRMAGQLFHVTNLLTLVLVLMVVALGALRQTGPCGRAMLLAPAVLLGASECLIRPLLETEKVAHGTQTLAFAQWHGVSSLLYALATVAAVTALVQALRRR
ncbi:MAG: DUF4149 domain-containing protein [Pseudomonadota bacterium]|jgi:hypothetical protein